jgi:hypothetical protein
MSDLATNGKLIESGLWLMVVFFVLIQALRSRRRARRVLSLLAGAFLVFGVSDLIEADTGAWWRPVWLLVLKGGCLVVLICGFGEYYRIRKSPET